MQSLLRVLVVVLATTVTTWAADQCTEALYGNPVGQAITLLDSYLGPGRQIWKVPIPDLPQCMQVNGVYSRVCDYDVPPEVSYVDAHTMLVYRPGQVLFHAVVHITMYCNT